MLILHTTQATPNLCPFVISAIWGCNWSSMSQIRTDGMWPLWKQHNKKVTTDTESYLGTDHLTSDCGQGKTFVKESTFLFFYNLKKIHNNLLHPLQGVRRIPKGTVPPPPPPPPQKKTGYLKVMLTFYLPIEFLILVNLQEIAGGEKCCFRWQILAVTAW